MSERELSESQHRWDYCSLCEREVVICGKCGNNTCNGGYGTLPDGSKCDACPSAYEMDNADRAALSQDTE